MPKLNKQINRIQLLFCSLIFVAFQNIQGQVVFKKYTSEDGLSQVSVNDILEDDNGFLWLATQSGLNRFDGNIFKTFHHKSDDSTSISGNFINCLLEDSYGNIWIGTENNGLCYYDIREHVFKTISLENETYSVYSITIDKNNTIWAAAGRLGVLKINKNRNVDLLSLPLERNFLTTAIFTTENSAKIYCADDHGYIYYFDSQDNDKSKFTIHEIGQIPEKKRVLNLREIKDNLLFVGSVGNGYLVESNTNSYSEQLFIPIFSKPTIVYDIEPNENNMFWVATGNGLYTVDIIGHSPTIINHYVTNDFNPSSLSNNTVYCLERTLDNALWVGTGKFLNVLNQSPNFYVVRAIPGSTNSLNSNVVFSIFKEGETLWLGTSGGGLNRFVGDITNYYTIENSDLLSNVVFSINTDLYGNLWIGTKKGVSIIAQNQKNKITPQILSLFDILPQHPELKNTFIRKVYRDKIGNMWVCTYNNGLIKLSGNIFSRQSNIRFFRNTGKAGSSEIASNRVYSIIQESDTVYWVGTSNGLNQLTFSGEGVKLQSFRYTEADKGSISNNVVYDLHIDNNKQLWVATRNGLNKYISGENRFQRFSTENGLLNNVIYSIESDADQNIWVSTNLGITKININTNSITNFTVEDGLQSNEFNLHSSFYDIKQKTMYFGGINGYNKFQPESLKKIDKITPIIVSAIDYIKDNSPIFLNELELNQVIESGLKLKHNDFPINVQLSTIDLRPFKNVQLAYRLLPSSENWNSLSSNNKIQLLKLQPGDYSLQIQGKSRGTIWDTTPINIKIKITPPFWRTWYAYGSYFVLFVLLVFAIYRIQLKNVLASREAKRLLELDKLKNQLYTEITHEFRTPLTIINGIAGDLKKNTGLEKLSLIERNGNQLLNLVNQMLDLSKLDNLRLDLKYIQNDIVPYIKYVFNCYSSWAEEKNIKYTFYSEIDELIMDYDPNQLYKIITNLLSNAIKYTNQNGEVLLHLSINSESNFLNIKVIDNGIGIELKDGVHIFERFYRSEKVKNSAGIGIGLSLTKNLVDLMGGEIALIPQQIGSCFKVTLPILKNADKPTENVNPDLIITRTESNSLVKRIKEDEKPNNDSTKILIVEDNKDVLTYIEDCLSEKYVIISATNGQQGIDSAIAEIPDLIITDLMMPQKNGFELCTEIKANIKTSHIPIVFITAKATEEDMIKAHSLGADAYLVKPFNKTELIVRIEQLLVNRIRIMKGFQVNIGSQTKQTKEEEFINQLNIEILKNLDNPEFKASDLAFKMNLSESQLYRKIKALTSRSTALYIRQIRLEKACEMLKENSHNISEIGYKCGFKDPAWFSRVFKEEFGIAPSSIQEK